MKRISDLVTVVKEESCDASVQDACTQTPPRRRKRRGGCGNVVVGGGGCLPLSRLLCLKETDAKSPSGKAKGLEEESTSNVLKVPEVKVKQEKLYEGEVKEEGVKCSSFGASTGESTLFTPRSFQSDVFPPSSHPFPHVLPFFPPCFPPPHMLQSSTLQPDALAPVGDVWGMPVVGHCTALCCLIMRCFCQDHGHARRLPASESIVMILCITFHIADLNKC